MPLVSEVAHAFSSEGIDLGKLGLAWARALPSVLIVPAFGLRALPVAARSVIGLALAFTIFPALVSVVPTSAWPISLGLEFLSGVPIAVAAAIPLWAATMAGGMIDTLRGSRSEFHIPVVEGKTSAFGVPFSILASTIFLGTGGPARIATALVTRPLLDHPILSLSHDLAGGIAIAVSLGAPLLAAAIVLEIAAALIARASAPAQIGSLLAPLRALAFLGIMGVVLDRIAGAIALAVRVAP